MPVLISQASLPMQKALAIVPKCTSLLSLLGSLYIVHDVLRMPRVKVVSYHRLMLGMSLFDCMASAAWFFTTWPIPPEVFPAWGAAGTQATCTAQGYFAQLSISTVFYNGCLAAYYFVVIRLGWSESRIQGSKIEYIFHMVAIFFGLGTSSAAAGMGLFNPIGWDCWLSAVPLGCQESWLNNGQTTCIRGDNANLWQWIFFYIPLWINIIFVGTIMTMIVWMFHKQETRISRWGSTLRRSNDQTRQVTRFSKRTKETLRQAIYYVGCFLVAWTFPTILRIHELLVDEVHYHWVLLSALFVPSQGIFNFFVYVRPRYQQICAQRQAKRNRHQTLRRAARQKNQQLEDGQARQDSAVDFTQDPSISRFEVEDETFKIVQPNDSNSGEMDTQKEVPRRESIFNFVHDMAHDMAQAVMEGDRGAGSFAVPVEQSHGWINDISMSSSENDVRELEDEEEESQPEAVEPQGDKSSELEEYAPRSSRVYKEAPIAIEDQLDDISVGSLKEVSIQEVEKDESPPEVEKPKKKKRNKQSSSRHSDWSEENILLQSLQSILTDMADEVARKPLPSTS